jgi:hypothetical protein
VAVKGWRVRSNEAALPSAQCPVRNSCYWASGFGLRLRRLGLGAQRDRGARGGRGGGEGGGAHAHAPLAAGSWEVLCY